VLNLITGRVSPQFHVQFDPSFQTAKRSFGGTSPPSLWQEVCGFGKSRVSLDSKSQTRSSADRLANQAGPTHNYGPDSQNAPYASLETREPDDDDWSDTASVDTPTGILQEPVLTQEHDDHDGDQTVRRSTRTF